MKTHGKVLILAVSALFLIFTYGITAEADTLAPIFTMQPILTGLIPLPTPTATPTFFQPIITDIIIPIPQNSWEIIPIPIPMEVLSKWVEVNDSHPLYLPVDVVADRNRVKILDWTNNGRLNVYDIASDTWYNLEPPASIGAMGLPCGMCEGENGSVYIADTFKHRVLKCEQNGSWSIVGDTGFSEPRAVAYSGGTLYVADSGNDRIRYLSGGSWQEITKVGVSTTFDSLTDIKIKNDCGMLIADGGNYYIIDKQPAGQAYSIISDLSYIGYQIRVYPDKNNDLYISSMVTDTLVKFDGTDFTSLMSAGSAVGRVDNPMGVFDDGLGQVYVADMANNRVQRNKTAESTLTDLTLDSNTIAGFAPGQTEYSVSCPSNKETVGIAAFSTSPYAQVGGDTGTQSLDYGENIFEITVDPEWGADNVYTITITRQSPETPTSTPTPTLTPEAAPSDTASASSQEASDSPQSPGAETGTLPPTNPPDDSVSEAPEAKENVPVSEGSQSEGGAVPLWAIIVAAVLASGVVVVGGILIYMSVKGKSKKPDDKDFE